MPEERPTRLGRLGLRARFTFVSWRDLTATLGPIVVLTAIALWLALIFVRPAPPDTIVFTSGPAGSSFRNIAERYRKILARNRVKLEILASEGSLDNLRRLSDPAFKVDVGFVQGGVAGAMNVENLVSLGSVFNQPLAVFYRGDQTIDKLSQLTGKKIALGHEGSGARFLSLVLLKQSGITPGATTEVFDIAANDVPQALIDGKIDAAFLMGDSAAPPVMAKLLRTPGIQLLSFAQADAYVRRFRYLNKLELPMGSIDLARNIPEHDIALIGPTTELVARESLHPALSDLLIEAAREVHGGASLLQRAGEFPAPVEREFRISDDATRYYKSGKSFLYRYLPFWVASLVDRTFVLLVPIIVLLIPGLRVVPGLYRWRVRSRIYHWYGRLLALERATYAHPEKRDELMKQLDEIEAGVNRMKMPLSYADQFYVLREHIGFVRNRLR